MKKIITIIGFSLALFICAQGQNATPDDEIAIRATAMNYIEEAKVNGEWKIINVLWELKPRPEIQSQIQFKALVITHVTVIDVRDGHTRPDMTVVISGNRIVEMGEAGRTNLP